MSGCSDIIAAKDAQIRVLREVISEQQDRILELERENDQLRARKDELEQARASAAEALRV